MNRRAEVEISNKSEAMFMAKECSGLLGSLALSLKILLQKDDSYPRVMKINPSTVIGNLKSMDYYTKISFSSEETNNYLNIRAKLADLSSD